MKPTILDELGLSAKPTKTPWFLRFAVAKKPKEMAATVGLATIYRLLFAGILLALPGEGVQAQCEVQIPCYENTEFGDATNKADCDRILQEALEKIKKRGEEISKAWAAARRCDERYEEELKMNNLVHEGALIADELQADNIFYECLGISALVGGGAYEGANLAIQKIRGGITTTVRIGTAALGTVITIGVFAACKSTRDDTLQSSIDLANAEKKQADKMSLTKRDECRITTDYARAKRRYDRWIGGRYPSGKGYRYNIGNYRRAINRANADHEKCLALFPSGDCGTTD